MKKLVLGLVAVTAAASVLAQGTVLFNNRTTGVLITHVYGPQVGTPTVSTIGNAANDTPAGTQTYTGAMIAGNAYTAQLWAAPGADALESSMQAATPTSTFRTGGAAGNWVAATATLVGVAADAAVATMQIRVYPSAYPNWEAAEAAWTADMTETVWIGKSPMFNVNAIGGTLNPAPSLLGLQSFSLVSHVVPEPSTFALLGLGALGMMIFRRK